MTSRQFQAWRAYADLEPFDEVRADMRTADIVRTLLNVNRKKGTPPISLDKCVLRFGARPAEPAPRTAEQARSQVRQTMDILMRIYNTPEPEAPKRARRLKQ
jgi:hypothetical protein